MSGAFLLLMQGAIPQTPWELIRESTAVTRVVLVVLAILSLISWAVIFATWIQLSVANSRAQRFAEEFDRTRRLDEAASLARRSMKSALSKLFLRASHFVVETKGASLRVKETTSESAGTLPNVTLTGSQLEALHLILDAEADEERERLGRHTPWLATIGSVSPLLGLLGTTIGIINAFTGIATKGSGNLAAVAPGVAEALVATFAGLAAAIPAVIAYNLYVNRVRLFAGELEGFANELIGTMAREGLV